MNITRIYCLILLLLSAIVQTYGANSNEEYLIQSVKSRNWDNVKFAIEGRFVSPNIKDEYGATPLMYAVRNGSERIAQYLIDNGANINEKLNHLSVKNKTEEGEYEDVRHLKTILNLAVYSGKTSMVELLRKNGAKIDEKDYLNNPVVIASWNNDYKMLKFLDIFYSYKVPKDVTLKTLLYIINRYVSNEEDSFDINILDYWKARYEIEISDKVFREIDAKNKTHLYNEKVNGIIKRYTDFYADTT